MVLPSDDDELTVAWRALAGADTSQGWRTIPICAGSPSPLMAGRRFPENHEALLVGFAPKRALVPQALPQGRGFEVARAELAAGPKGQVWIGLVRHSAG